MNEPIVIAVKNPYLSQIAYVVGNQETKTCIVIDPSLDIKRVEVEWEARGWTLVGVLMTHLHADHVSGAHLLYEKYGVGMIANYVDNRIAEGNYFGNAGFDIKIIKTPGHSKDSVVYNIWDCLFTGDTLLVGSCGRPDLGITNNDEFEAQCKELFQSLKGLKNNLHPDSIIYPAHGAGSLCGSGIGGDDSSILKREIETNPALQFDDPDKFVEWISSDIPFRPLYFDRVKQINNGTFVYPETVKSDAIYVQVYDDLVVEHFERDYETNLDIAHGIWIGKGMKFETWLGALVDSFFYVQFREYANDTLEVMQRKKSDLVNRIASVGMDHLFLGFIDIKESVDGRSVERLPMPVYEDQQYDLLVDVRTVADVRKNGKKFAHAFHVPIDELRQVIMPSKNRHKYERIAVHCNGGYLSQIAQSILLDAGFQTVLNVKDLNLITRP